MQKEQSRHLSHSHFVSHGVVLGAQKRSHAPRTAKNGGNIRQFSDPQSLMDGRYNGEAWRRRIEPRTYAIEELST